jgi:hypothetical protein
MTDNIYHPLTVIETEQLLRDINRSLGEAVRDLRAARQEELKALKAYRRVYRKAMFSEDCPVVSRGTATVADRDAWVEEQVEAEWFAHQVAEGAREDAKNFLQTVKEQASVLQSIASGQRTLMKLGL